MQVRIKSGQTLSEPITASEWRDYSGNQDTSQDLDIETMITAARKWLEDHTGISVIEKSYEAQFDKSDGYENWYELPFSPVVSITSVEIDDTAVTYSERGLDTIEIYPDSVIGTGTTSSAIDVEFVAGRSDERANIILYRIVTDYYDAKKDNPAADMSSSIPRWDTMKLVNSLSNNITI